MEKVRLNYAYKIKVGTLVTKPGRTVVYRVISSQCHEVVLKLHDGKLPDRGNTITVTPTEMLNVVEL